MVEVARDTCIATFPSFPVIEQKLAVKGMAKDDQGIWRGPVTIHVMRPSGTAVPDCEIWMAFGSRVKDVSDVLQASLSRLNVQVQSAQRRGMRLSATFNHNGAAGVIPTEAMNGRTSKIVVSAGGGS
ncbi:MAG: hypothetical protein AAF307_05720 [Pseudomonadota bacterium]